MPKSVLKKMRSTKKTITPLFFGTLVILIPILLITILNPRKTKAAWFDYNWGLRQTVAITNNGSEISNHVIQVVVDTATIIAAGDMQSDCDDARFAGTDGTVYSHFLDIGCNTSKTVFFVDIQTIAAGSSEIYIYYDNASATSTSTYTNHMASINIGNGADGDITVSSSTNINTTSLISGRSCADGGDAVNYSVTANTSSGQNQITLSSTPASGCLAVGDEVLIINLQGTSGNYTDVGEYETARITDIATATLTLNHNLINGYDGTTQKIVVQRVPNYNDITVNGSQTLNVTAWNGTKGGVLFFRADGTATVTGNISVASLGYRGGSAGAGNTSGGAGGGNGESYEGTNGAGSSGTTNSASNGAGKSGDNTTAAVSGGVRGGGGGGGSDGSANGTNGGGGGGAGGGHAGGGGGGGGNADSATSGGAGGSGATSAGTNAGGGGGACRGANAAATGGNAGSAGTTPACATANGTGGAVGSGTTTGGGGGGSNGTAGAGAGGGGGGYYGNTTLTTIFPGSGGGGGGGGDGAGRDGAAGSIGGGIIYIGAKTLTVAGTISANGQAGSAGSTGGGGGGGGAGGSVYLTGQTLTLGTSLVSATGGAVGGTNTRVAGSGAGSVGRIYTTYSSTSGSANPAATTATLPIVSSISTEEDQSSEAAPTDNLVASWALDEGYGTTTADSTGNGFTGTLAGSTIPTWQPVDMCKQEKCLYFDGTTSKVTVASNLNYIKTISFWVKPNNVSSAALIDINGTARITVSSGTISATGFDSPTIYVNGNVSSTLAANEWQYVTVTTATPVSGWAFKLGNYSSTYLQGFMDEIKVYNYVRSTDEITIDLLGGAAVFGHDSLNATSNGLLGYWKLNESSGNAVDSSGNSLTLTNNGTTTYVTGKYGRGSEHVPASTQYLSTATAINGIKTVSFWTNPDSTTNYFITLTASAYITASSGTISATGFTNPTIYVNGVVSSTIAADTWQLVTVTTDTAINADSFYVGRQGGNYYDGTLDEIRLYNKSVTPTELAIIRNTYPGPIAHYKLDENTGTTTTYDVSGNGNNLTLSNITASSWTAGKYGSGLDIESGSSQHATLTDNATMSLTSDLTLAAWIKPESVTASTTFGIVSKNDTGGTSYAMSQYGDEIRVFIGSRSNYETTDTANLAVDTWYHVEAIYRASAQTVDIYINGSLQASTTTGTIPTSITDDTDDFSVGSAMATITTTVNLQADTSSDDGDTDIASDSANSLTRHTMPIGSFNGNSHMGAAYFSTVNVPQGVTITEAIFTATGALSYDCVSCTLSARVYMEDADDAVAINSTNMNDKTLTTANTTWNMTAIVAGTDYETNITSAVQEVIDRGGWSSGNDMTALIRDNSSSASEWQDFCTYDSDANGEHTSCTGGAKAPTLDITYQTVGYVYYDGVIDDVRVYNYARSVDGVIEDMNGGHPLGGSPISSKVLQYNFDEQQGTTANNNNSAQSTITGSISGAIWLRQNNCKYNGCLDFDGSNDAITVTNTSAIDFDTGLNAGFTLSAWINPDSDGETDVGQIFYKGTNTWCRTDTESGGYVDIECSLDLATDATLNISTAIPINTWTHFAIAYTDDADDEITIYINGLAAGTSTNGVGPVAGDTNDLLIGGSTNFDGSIDDFKLYSSELTAAQILIDMNSNATANFGSGTIEAAGLVDGAPGNLLAWWKLDENTGTTATDFSGNGNTGTLDNGPTWEKGKYGSSVQFSTTNDSINMGDVLDLTNTDFTISFWLYRTATPVDSTLIANKTTAGGTAAGFTIFQWAPGSDGVICFYIADGTDAYETCTAANTAETLNTWEHIVVVFDRTSAAATTIYQNGVDAEFPGYEIGNPANIDSITSSDIFCVGARPNSVTDCNNGTPRSFLGKLDDIQIYGEALTPAQVAYLYNRGEPMGWWKLDECTGTTAYDSGSGGNNGTITPGAGTHTSAGTCGSTSASEMWDDGLTGKRNYSLDFDGSDDYVDMNDTSEFDYNDKDFTITGWFNRETYTTDDTIIAKKNDQANSSAGFVVWIDDSTDDLRLVVSDGDSTNLHTVNSTSSFTATGWQHFAITYDDSSASGTQIYINGVSDSATNSTTGTFASIGDMSNAVDLRIGAESDGGNPFAGELDDIRIYNYALSETQVKRVLNDDAAIRFGPAEGAP